MFTFWLPANECECVALSKVVEVDKWMLLYSLSFFFAIKSKMYWMFDMEGAGRLYHVCWILCTFYCLIVSGKFLTMTQIQTLKFDYILENLFGKYETSFLFCLRSSRNCKVSFLHMPNTSIYQVYFCDQYCRF